MKPRALRRGHFVPRTSVKKLVESWSYREVVAGKVRMHPIFVSNPDLATKLIVAAICIVGLVLFIRSYRRNGRL